MTTTVLLVDDHGIVRDGLRQRLEQAGGFDVVAEAANVLDAMRLAVQHEPDLMVVDIRMPGGTGVDVIREVRSRELRTRCLVVTSFGDEQAYATAVMAGADGYLIKTEAPERIVDVAGRIVAGEKVLDPSVVTDRSTDVSRMLDDLTDREKDILELVAVGRTNREIATELNLAEKTVRNYVSTILTKTGRRNRTELAAYLAGRAHPE